jgi:hypothetical protein
VLKILKPWWLMQVEFEIAGTCEDGVAY